KVEGEDRERLITWVDCNGPYLGDEEIRCMFDPQTETVETIPPIRPRIATAPVINRFDLRQDGNTKEMLGELKLLKDAPKNFDPNSRVTEYQLKSIIEKEPKVKIDIISAKYGANSTWKDVKDNLNSVATGTRFYPIGKYNDSFGDPIDGTKKVLHVTYKVEDGPELTKEFQENETILLPLNN
ncbi:MAG: hypothetical protein ACRC2T_20860, partial [Thermoguttaceae bacterium]